MLDPNPRFSPAARPARLRNRDRRFRALALGGALVMGLAAQMLATPAYAASASTNFNVTALVATACTVSASDLAFGTYDASSATDATANSTISVTCSLLTPYTISLNNGTHASGSIRRMGTGASRLTYEMYRDAGLSGIFGLVTSSLGISGIGTGLAIPTTVYGKIPKNQIVAPGSYADQVTVTVDY